MALLDSDGIAAGVVCGSVLPPCGAMLCPGFLPERDKQLGAGV
jgi:hypothetical protein